MAFLYCNETFQIWNLDLSEITINGTYQNIAAKTRIHKSPITCGMVWNVYSWKNMLDIVTALASKAIRVAITNFFLLFCLVQYSSWSLLGYGNGEFYIFSNDFKQIAERNIMKRMYNISLLRWKKAITSISIGEIPEKCYENIHICFKNIYTCDRSCEKLFMQINPCLIFFSSKEFSDLFFLLSTVFNFLKLK